MTDLTPNHPAVEAGAERFRAEMMDTKWGDSWASIGERAKRNWRIRAHGVLTAALPHLTADDLRDTPVGRALMAEGWDQGWRDRKQYDQDIDWRTIPVTDTNPYRDGDA